MKYPDGQEIRLGDTVRLDGNAEGVVVFSIDTNEYAAEFPGDAWDYLKRGVMIDFPEYGLIHFDHDAPDLTLVRRAG
ncbi:hypothetical protein [Bradyrhizobium jicamae]|uniref:hypothetical protein n=1 Tax=Bradyrhizobium jicamae TaxID=280332 RepID=UPI001BA497E7|nr:hypothetical protein [Bradyrhizobium jicamae]MBR0938592.1 hypothetical protein [Bradyrhizobium jicamae]